MSIRAVICSAFLLLFAINAASSGSVNPSTNVIRHSAKAVVCPPDTTPFKVRVGIKSMVLWGQLADVPLLLDTAAYPLGGFDFLLAFNNTDLTFMQATASDTSNFLSNCGWEYFTYRTVSITPSLQNATLAVRLVAIAETNNGDNHPSCRLPEHFPATLATVRFLIRDDRNLECTFLPVSFLWTGCADNLIIDSTGRHLYISSVVRDVLGNEIQANDTFPTLKGAPDSCLWYAWTGDTIVQAVSFQNGGVDVAGPCDIDATGDINLNGVAYEIADYVMFSDYFLYGLAAFPHPAGSMAESDINGDGITLTVSDLLEMFRVVIGDAVPLYPPVHSLHDAHVLCDQSTGLVKIETPDTLGAIWLAFAGNADSVTINPGYSDELKWNYVVDDRQTRVLVAPLLSYDPQDPLRLDSIIDAELHVYPPLALVHADVTTHKAGIVTTIIDNPTGVDETEDGSLPSKFVCRQNYPNPFNLSTTISFELPAPSTVRLEIVNLIGQVVRTISGFYSVGAHSVSWDGTTDTGHTVSSGIYYARLTAGAYGAVKKMVLLK